MINLTGFVCVMFVNLLLATPGTLARLYFHPLQDCGSSFKENVFNRLQDIPSSHVCIWSHQTDVGGLVSDLLISLTSSGKSVTSLKLTEEAVFYEECLHSLLVLKDFTTCGKIWTTRRPITALHFIYVVVDEKWLLGVGGLPLCLSNFGFARVVLVFLQDGNVFSLSHPLFPPRHFLEAQLNDLLSPVKLVFKNLHGREVNVAAFNCTPYVVFYNGYNSESADGVEGRILKELPSLLNFKMKIVEMSKDKYGTRTNESWGEGGIMGALKDYEAEIGVCNIWSDLTNIPVLDFAPYNNVVAYTFLVPRPRVLRGSWKTLTASFEIHVWFEAVLFYFVCSFCYWLHCKIITPEDNVDGVESLLVVFGMLMLTSWHSRTAARQLVLWWSVFVLLLTATYSSSIAARLTKPSYEPRIDTVQQLVDRNFHWYSNHIENKQKNFFLNTEDPTQRKWANRYKYLPAHMTSTSIRSRKYAFLVQRLGSSMLVLDVHGLDYDRDLKGLRVLKEKTIDNIFTCFGFPKQSALSYTLQNALLTLRQMGLIDYWTTDAVERFTPPYVQDLQQENDVNAHVILKALSGHNLKPAFIMLLSGLCLSSVLFSLELLYHRCTLINNCNKEVRPITPFVK